MDRLAHGGESFGAPVPFGGAGKRRGAALALAGRRCRRLKLEITESVLMPTRRRPRRPLINWPQWLPVAIDDFGNGLFVAVHIQRFPINVLKVRGKKNPLVRRGHSRDSDDAAMRQHIVAMAHNPGWTVIAEGVGDPMSARLLARFCAVMHAGLSVQQTCACR